jgi:hypothetical protein
MAKRSRTRYHGNCLYWQLKEALLRETFGALRRAGYIFLQLFLPRELDADESSESIVVCSWFWHY